MLFSVPLGNTTAHNEHIKSKIRVEQAQDQVKSLSWKIRNEIENDMRALISARLQIQLADKSSQFAEQRYEQYRQSSLLNLASIQDLINADNDLNIARNSQLEAVETFSNAVTKLWKDTGLLLDHHGIHVDKSKPEGATSIREQEPSGLPTVTDRSTEVEETPETPAPASVNQSPIPLAAPAAKKTYTLTIGEFTNKAAMVDAVSKIEIVGLTPQVKEGPQRTERVIRLYMAEFSTQLPAQKALKKVQLFKGNGFIQLNEKKHYVVYAGSFLDENAALKEQTRLSTQGIKVRTEKTSVSFVTSKLSAGNFLGQETALKYAKKLEQLGLKAVVTETP